MKKANKEIISRLVFWFFMIGICSGMWYGIVVLFIHLARKVF